MRTEVLCISVLRVASGPRVKLASCKSALTPPPHPPRPRFTLLTVLMRWSRCWSYSFVVLWFILRCDLFYVLPCVILVLCFFSTFSIEITSLGEERVNLSPFRKFVRFVLVWFCWFPLPLGVWEGLLFAIVELTGLFFYLTFLLY